MTYPHAEGDMHPQPTQQHSTNRRIPAIPRLMAALITTVASLGLMLLLSSPASAQGVAPGDLNFEATSSCLGDSARSGRIDVDFTNTADSTADFDVTVGTVGPRTTTLAPGQSTRTTVTGRPDGPITITVASTATIPETLSKQAIVQCGPTRGEFDAETSCLAGRGRVDIWLTSAAWPDGVAPAVQVYWTVSLHATDPNTGAELPNPIIREIELPAGHGPTKVSITGRADGAYIARGSVGSGIPVIDPIDYSEMIEVDCFDEPSSFITNSCLAGNGRVDAYLNNEGADVGEYEVFVGDLEARTLTLQPGRTGRITVTGRPDGLLAVAATRNGDLELLEQIEIVCDIEGTRITVLNNGFDDFGFPIGPMAGVAVEAQDLVSDQRYTATTDANGQVVLQLPSSQYRFTMNANTPDPFCWYGASETQTVAGVFTNVVLEAWVACAAPGALPGS